MAVVITVLAKNIKKEELDVKYNENEVQVNFKLDEQHHNLTYKLSHTVVPAQCEYKLTPSKVNY